MKAINIKLATFSFAAMLLASCSDSNNIDSPTPKDETPTTIVGSAVKSITDPTVLASRVTNFKNANSTTIKLTVGERLSFQHLKIHT